VSGIVHRIVSANGIQLHVAEQGEGPLVLLLHGWPELWYSWRHQLPALAAAGYRAVAPDLRGFGQSAKPSAIDAYSLKQLLADVEGLLDALGEQDAVVVGHDVGAAIAWSVAALRADRCPAVVGMSVPHLGRAPIPPTKLFEQLFGERWFYLSYFQEPGVAERGIDVPAALPGWLSEKDLAYYVEQYEASGFRGGLNRYRNMDRDWEQLPELATTKIERPALFLVGEKDPGRALAPIDAMRAFVPDLEEIVIPDAGHWVQQEQPEAVNVALLRFLRTLRDH
jgi:pimeloyl-ACP methyl ester carboxylesterase